MVIGILDPRNNTITLSSVGHEYPMLCTVDGAITEIGKGQECHPLGVSDEDQYFDIPIELQPGSSASDPQGLSRRPLQPHQDAQSSAQGAKRILFALRAWVQAIKPSSET